MSNHYFIGTKVTPSIQEVLILWQSNLKEHMSYKVWRHPEDFHITLKFLGGCSDEIIREYIRLLRSEEWPLDFSLKVGPAGSFGDENTPRVFHANIEKVLPLCDIKEKVEKIGCSLGFQEEKRAYHPHVTLAKQQPEGKSPLACPEESTPFLNQHDMNVESFSIFKIHPKKTPRYEKIADIKLREKE